ncbi:SDR family oxidoreductase [Rhodanobacter sp. MP1X3]|uniref:SDR family oxidoreductase n=1 Tax=Rhodanobacter sp. MP1X3 TaxID=2723086 RepID=UPI00160A088E|nr:SDR family oxidoreductase [Rhodanobacter sp. MP1X3]MBB6241607.1 NAD(P)-dependent dehydrogenase (short-subunit alcohol dehydrogenase family) [Rhodanobacter sp. MP1X3]
MKIKGSTAFVTGANRGLGLAYAKALLAAGAIKVYASARDPSSVTLDGVVPIKLDVTNADDIAAAAAQCSDVDLLINNAGITVRGEALLSDLGVDSLRLLMETNVYGVLAVSRAFAPVLARNGGGVLVNMLSVLSWISLPGTSIYPVTKAAAWVVTNGLRNELSRQGTLVVGVHAGLIETDMIKGIGNATLPRSRPEDIAKAVMKGIEAGDSEVIADDTSRNVKAGFGKTPAAYLATSAQ